MNSKQDNILNMILNGSQLMYALIASVITKCNYNWFPIHLAPNRIPFAVNKSNNTRGLKSN